MKKKLLTLAAGVLAVAVIVLVALTFFLGSLVKAGINRFGPAITKTTVTLDNATLSPLTGGGTLSGLLIGNPAGWHADKAMSFGRLHLSVVPTSLLGDHIVVREIDIEQPEFVYETKVFSSNLRDLLKNIEASTGGGKDAAPTAAAKSGKPLKFEVRRFVLRNGKVTIGTGPAAVTVPLPELTFTNLGTSEGGITANQLAGAVMGRVLNHVLTTAAAALTNVGKTAGAAATNAAAGAAQKAGDEIKRMLGGK
ncbi:MAG TPA: hypothetical protein VMD31_02705 [Opitutaceae bacterium]|nr:hypothetical protein [Opitutaceae bacterium]